MKDLCEEKHDAGVKELMSNIYIFSILGRDRRVFNISRTMRAVSPGSQVCKMYAGDVTGRKFLWDDGDDAAARIFQEEKPGSYSFRFSCSTAVYPEGQYFFTAAKDGSIKVHCNFLFIRVKMNMNSVAKKARINGTASLFCFAILLCIVDLEL